LGKLMNSYYKSSLPSLKVKSKVKLDFSQPSDVAATLNVTLSYLHTHLTDSSEEVSVVAYQLGYVMSRYLNCHCPVTGDTAKKQQSEAKKDLWEVVALRLEVV
jgi:hypothetical protein